MSSRRFLPLLAPLLLGGCGPDEGQAALCERVVRALEGKAGVTILDRETSKSDEAAVAIRYRTGPANTPEKTIVCRFAATGLGADRLRLSGVRRSDGTALSRLSLGRLKARLNLD